MAYKIDASLGTLNTSQGSPQLVRTSTGNLYAVIVTSGDLRVYKSTNQGVTWSQKDYANVPFASSTIAAAAIDGNDNIHITFAQSAVRYVLFTTSTDTYGPVEVVNSSSPTTVGIAVDSNNIPHVAYGLLNVSAYSNRIYGLWKAAVTVVSLAATNSSIDIQFTNDNIPYIFHANSNTHANVYRNRGNKNDATSFTNSNFSQVNSGPGGSSLAIDSVNTSWNAFQGTDDDVIYIHKHLVDAGWALASWTNLTTSGYKGYSVSIALDQSDVYVFYERAAGGIAYDRYDTVNNKWLGEQIIQANTPRSTTNIRYHNPSVKRSHFFNNGDTGANNKDQDTIEYLFDDGSTIYYDKLVTSQLSQGFFEIEPYATPPTTTSTSSTSSSTSTSISTSSTSTSISTSTSSTSSSISTSSTSSSTSVSTSSTSSSTSTSVSTSTSSTSSSTSKSTSTSSTSSSISTSSTSSSTSVSSTSSSISTSSTSSSISTSSTSNSTSTSSTSSSTSKSTSTSSTSSSTSISTSTSLSSTSSSTSMSTSSTSSSISTSSTSQSTSTSSTSSSVSTSSTSISTSTSRSTSTSSTSNSTSLSSSTSISSTSSSTSTTISTTTSTSSTSISTSSTSLSTSTSTTILDINTIPRAHIPSPPMYFRVTREKIAIKRLRGRA